MPLTPGRPCLAICAVLAGLIALLPLAVFEPVAASSASAAHSWGDHAGHPAADAGCDEPCLHAEQPALLQVIASRGPACFSRRCPRRAVATDAPEEGPPLRPPID